MRYATILLASAIWAGCVLRCEPVALVDPSPAAKATHIDPIKHAADAFQACFDAAGYDIDASGLDLAFWGRSYSHVPDAFTVRFTVGMARVLSIADISDQRWQASRDHLCHEAEHVHQAQGRSRLAWWWYYIWNGDRLEREAEAMAERYRGVVR